MVAPTTCVATPRLTHSAMRKKKRKMTPPSRYDDYDDDDDDGGGDESPSAFPLSYDDGDGDGSPSQRVVVEELKLMWWL